MLPDPPPGPVDARRAVTVRRASTVVMVVSLVGALAVGALAFSGSSSAEPVLWATPQTTRPAPDAVAPTSTVTARVTRDTGLPVIATPQPDPSDPADLLDEPQPAESSGQDRAPSASEPRPADPGRATDRPAPTTTTTTTLPPLRLPQRVSSTRSTFGGFPIVPVGTEENGELEVPGAREIGWYERGGAPGRPGATVLAAHVSWNGDLGPFWNLGESQVGDEVEVILEDGTERRYVVTEVAMYDKYELPGDRVWRRTGPETLVLITCGGEFDDTINRYKHNIVVYAEPIE